MIDLKLKQHTPTLTEIAEVVRTPVFLEFCARVEETFQCTGTAEYSACSMEPGWNVKFRKGGKALCTIYPREGYFTVMVVVGRKEKEAVEAALPDWAPELGEIYRQTREGNGQRWLMVDLEDRGQLCDDLFRLMEIRRKTR